MRRPFACLGLLLCAGALLAAGRIIEPAPAGGPPSTERHGEAQSYAQQLFYVTTQVAEQYVRPVSRAELVAAALRGLYEAVRVPVPASLSRELRQATSDQELLAVLAHTREALGDPDELRGANDLLVSCRAMTRCLDPYSAVVSDEDLRRGGGVDEQQGIGVELEDNAGAGAVRLKTVLPGGPAQVAGLRPGDEITQIDGKAVEGMTSGQVLLLCNFLHAGAPNPDEPAPSSIRLSVRHADASGPRTLALERQEWQPETVLGLVRQADNSWDYWLDRPQGIGLVRLGNLGNGTALHLRETLTRLQAAGLRGLILDLRWSPGGYLREAVGVASLFLGNGTVVTVQTRTQPDNPYPSTRENKFLDFPVVVLVNGETSGGAELIAAALQDHERAAIIGQRTLGKGSIQTVIALGAPNAGLKLTTGTFLRPSGKNLHRFPDSKPADEWGVRPDPHRECRVSPDLNRQLRQWWLDQTLRPGSSNTALPLDDPSADPPLQAALEALLTQLRSPRVATRGP